VGWDSLLVLSRPGVNYWAGVLAACLVIAGFARAKEWEGWRVWDAWAVVVAVELAIGAVGVLLNEGELVKNSWGIIWAIASFVVVSWIRKNYRFLAWYKGEASVARPGLAALVLVGLGGIYVLGMAVITGNYLSMGVVGGGVSLLAGGEIYRRSDLVTSGKRRKNAVSKSAT